MSDKYSGLEAALRSARMTFVSEANAGDRTGTEIIACEDLLPAWTKAGPRGTAATRSARRVPIPRCPAFPQRSVYLAFFITSLSRSKEACHEKGH